MARELFHVAARLFNAPLLILPETAVTIATNLAARFGIEPIRNVEALPAPAAAIMFPGDDDQDDDRPYAMSDGIATISVRGELVNRGSWLSSFSGLTTYETLANSLRQAVEDDAVRGVLLDIDSPGGEAAGAMEAAAVVRSVASAKPVKAFVNSLAASAAYAIAAGADTITVTPSSTVGSIGVVLLHIDRSQAMDKAGMKPTLIHAGAYKTDGHSTKPLGDDAKGRIQAMVDGVYDLFVASVAEHRATLTEDAVRKTEAGLFMGAAAVAAGLADNVGTLADVLNSFPKTTKGSAFAPLPKGAYMTTQTSIPEGHVSKPDHDATVIAATTKAHAEGREIGIKAGSTAERERIKAILTCEDAKGREASALHLALATSMSVEDARGALAGLVAAAPAAATPPAPAPAPKGNRLDNLVPVPKVEPDAIADGPKSERERGLAAFASVFPKKVA